MPESRNRPGHHFQKPADIPAKQRTRGKVVWSILFAIFGFLMGMFATEGGYVAPVTGAVIGAVIGYIIGKNIDSGASR